MPFDDGQASVGSNLDGRDRVLWRAFAKLRGHRPVRLVGGYAQRCTKVLWAIVATDRSMKNAWQGVLNETEPRYTLRSNS